MTAKYYLFSIFIVYRTPCLWASCTNYCSRLRLLWSSDAEENSSPRSLRRSSCVVYANTDFCVRTCHICLSLPE